MGAAQNTDHLDPLTHSLLPIASNPDQSDILGLCAASSLGRVLEARCLVGATSLGVRHTPSDHPVTRPWVTEPADPLKRVRGPLVTPS
jgi:hypothetical protein